MPIEKSFWRWIIAAVSLLAALVTLIEFGFNVNDGLGWLNGISKSDSVEVQTPSSEKRDAATNRQENVTSTLQESTTHGEDLGNEVSKKIPRPPHRREIEALSSGNSTRLPACGSSLSVEFHSVGGEQISTIIVIPPHGRVIRQPVLGGGKTIRFETEGGHCVLQILDVDFDQRAIRYRVDVRS